MDKQATADRTRKATKLERAQAAWGAYRVTQSSGDWARADRALGSAYNDAMRRSDVRTLDACAVIMREMRAVAKM